ncbi:MAG: hypothetical protein KatS3mg005_1887 [Bryobacteraceae bacterium]|nr:MAG: hypothetical protein KatS3mg005_1887 [Bryobacteraceae bacterium]
MSNLAAKKKPASERLAKHLEASPERQELEQLRHAENELGAIFVAMEPLWKALPRVRQHYEWYLWLNREFRQLPGEKPEAAQTPSDAEEYRIPTFVIRDGLERPEIVLRTINRNQQPDANELFREIDAFYWTFETLFKAALAVRLPPTVNLPDIEDQDYLETEDVPVEVMARRALKRVLDRNSLRRRYQLVAALLQAVIERRKQEDCWLTPQGRKTELREYCKRYRLTIDEFANLLECDRQTIYNWAKCKGVGTGPKAQLIEQVLRENIPPNGIAKLRARIEAE